MWSLVVYLNSKMRVAIPAARRATVAVRYVWIPNGLDILELVIQRAGRPLDIMSSLMSMYNSLESTT